jgi:hypothetical protein
MKFLKTLSTMAVNSVVLLFLVPRHWFTLAFARSPK